MLLPHRRRARSWGRGSSMGANALCPKGDRRTQGLDPLRQIRLVTLAFELVTVLPEASWTVTCTAGLIVPPAAVLDGWAVTASLLAGPGVMLKEELEAAVRPVPDDEHITVRRLP